MHEELLEFAFALCDEATAIAMTHFRRDLQISSKPDRTLVTQADTAIEARLRERIADRYPAHGILGEEFGAEGEAGARWIVDPIDATNNFVRGVPVFATLVAFEQDGRVQVGVVAAPASGERWHAVRGGGAWAGERRLRVSDVARLADAHVLFGDALAADRYGLAGFPDLLRAAWRNRGFGDYWGYALVAEGAGDVMVDPHVSPWDLAAPSILVEEAGGRFSDISGTSTIDGGSGLATNGRLHDAVLEMLGAGGGSGDRRADSSDSARKSERSPDQHAGSGDRRADSSDSARERERSPDQQADDGPGGLPANPPRTE